MSGFGNFGDGFAISNGTLADVSDMIASMCSNLTTAAFTLPFAFPVDITALAQNIAAGYDGQSFAELVIPWGPSTTDVQNRIMYLTFSNVPFAVYPGQHATFQNFVAATTLGSSQTLALSGTANADASTAVGVLSLVDIEFSVQSAIAGLQELKARPASVANLDVNHGYEDYLLITVDTSLFNQRYVRSFMQMDLMFKMPLYSLVAT
jgi:hypothetical protein